MLDKHMVEKSENIVVSDCTSSVQTTPEQLCAVSKRGLEISWPLWTSRSHAFLCKLRCILVPRTPLYTLAMWFVRICRYDDCGLEITQYRIEQWKNIDYYILHWIIYYYTLFNSHDYGSSCSRTSKVEDWVLLHSFATFWIFQQVHSTSMGICG